GYVLFITFFIYFNLGLFGAMLCQILISGIAGYCLFKIGSKIWNKNIGIVSLFIFLFYFPLQQWTFYILTDSLFMSLGVIGFYFLISKGSKLKSLFGIVLLVYTISLRPFGIIILPTLIFYFYLIIRNKNNLIYYLYIFLIFSSIAIAITLINRYFENLKIITIFSRGDIIWNYYSLQPPFEVSKYENQNNLYTLALLIFNYPKFFAEVFIHKIFWFFVRYRPYYSDLNNLILISFSIYFYLFSILGILNNSKHKTIIFTFLVYIFLTMCSVALTVADWDGRFSLPILPFIVLFSSSGVVRFFQLIIKKYIKNY
ncbi:hypothetical protein OAZ07_01380, partial [Pelagibacteraceae bacterium]|nr:hypothetical protein [Pelagibacteraceae bacterium]